VDANGPSFQAMSVLTASRESIRPARLVVLKTVGGEIAALRRSQGMSQADLAELSGLHYNSLGRIERGECDPSIVLLSYLYFQLDSASVAIDRYGVVPVHEDGCDIAGLPEIAGMRPPEMIRRLGAAIRIRRKAMDQTLQDTAGLSGVHLNSLWNLENGLVCPTLLTYYHILRALDVSRVTQAKGAPLFI
jgi:transcriptional regulator with XRE-family HTH domain